MEGAGIIGREEIQRYSDSLDYSGEAPGCSLGLCVPPCKIRFNKYPCEINVARSLKPIDIAYAPGLIGLITLLYPQMVSFDPAFSKTPVLLLSLFPSTSTPLLGCQ